MNSSAIRMGTLAEAWNGIDGKARNITFSITEDCNLACKYCYMIGKNNFKKMSFETAKKAVDYILNDREFFNNESIVWEFIGGEPFLEIDLIDKVSDYIKQQMFLLNHPWFNSYRFSFSTNGLLYDSPKVQKYIEKNKRHVSIGISVDGNKLKHDMQRVFPDGSGSYDEVVKKVPLWLEQFPDAQTKATFAHDDLPHIKDSVISLWDLGIKSVAANVVFEDVWHEGDDEIFEAQLRELADHVLDNKLWKDYSVRFFDPNIGFPLTEELKNSNFCGAGKMTAIGTDGKIYPCIRFSDFTLNNRKGLSIGHVDTGINADKLRPFSVLSLKAQSPNECVECDVATGCAWCTGFNYDAADTDTVYQRATFQCKMHKANVRANKYFWSKFEEVTGLESERRKLERANDKWNQHKYLQIIASDNITPHCTYRNLKNTNNVICDKTLKKALEFASNNKFVPVMLGTSKDILKDAISIVDSKDELSKGYSIKVYDNTINGLENAGGMCILLINKENLNNISEYVSKLYGKHSRVNVILEDIEGWDDLNVQAYKKQLEKLKSFVADTYRKGEPLHLNTLTDRIEQTSMCNCDAGNTTFTLAPNGKIYICPAFYFDDPESYIGDLDNGIKIKNPQLMEFETAGICHECDAYQCRRCKFLNKKLTNEYNIPSKIQCVVSHLERNASRELQEILVNEGFMNTNNIISKINYLDPLEKVLSMRGE